MMKILAAVMDVAILRFCRKEWRIKRTVKKCLVYDPRLVIVPTRYFGKKAKDERAKQIR